MACLTPYYVLPAKAALEKVPVPCGKCPSCKLRKVNDWVFRLLQEERHARSSLFLTLTYDTQSVPITPNGFMSLDKKDYQKFMKRLRKELPSHRFKYYAVGEYGTKTNRPHYHAILLGSQGMALTDLQRIWGLGSVHVGTVTADSLAYTLKYVMKDFKIPMHARDDRQKEFSLSSNGIGASYLTDSVVQYHRQNPSDTRVQSSGYKRSMPRYYRDKIFDSDERALLLPDIAEAVALDQHVAELRARRNYPDRELDYDKYLAAQKAAAFTTKKNHRSNETL